MFVGDGQSTKFWDHKWAGSMPLKLMFPRLYLLSANKEALISESGSWENGGWKWDLSWRRELFEREKSGVHDLLSFISGANLVAGVPDDWFWSAAKDGIYSTKSAYEAIKETRQERQNSEAINEILSKVWKSPVPLKARVMAWWTLRDRLPTCANLRRRNIVLNEVDTGCNACFHSEETINHLLFHCPKTEKVWDDIFRWLGICFVRPQSVVSHFLLFTNFGNRKESRKFLPALWCCVVWVVWRCRNASRFEGKGWEISKVVSEIKVRMWGWGKIFGFLNSDLSLDDWIAGVPTPLML
ncbi:uncharacterized protein LOC130993998 [Salvia miltiorrhiza]|uniref:uncharacterized protein LOC130993998 n=1 Tax=Salvia miltiorrhiza TaxID=226208 RepID=UPI0025ACE189|nr:uncharacterized protein LOC130993998 [Salvia miltiorrhiza]